MTLDRYTPCPCGTGKKIKFCCEDLLAELEKIQRMLEGEQRLACLKYVNTVRQKHPKRACLLAVKTLLEGELELEEVDATLDLFLELHPKNPIALAEEAVRRAEMDGAREGIEPLQRAIVAIEEHMPARVYEAIGIIGASLLHEGLILPGRAHLLLQAGISGAEDTRALKIIASVQRSAEVPLLLKDDRPLLDAPENVPWQEEFRTALIDAMSGAWLEAANKLAAIADRAPRAEAVWFNLSRLRCWIADLSGAVVALRKYASLDIPLDDAVEAEALAQLLDESLETETIDVVSLTYEIADLDSLNEHLQASGRAEPMPYDFPAVGEDGEIPPMAGYWLIDRDMPQTGVDIKAEEVPNVLGQFFVFRKQTDRAAHLEFICDRGPEHQQSLDALAEFGGDRIGNEPVEEKEVNKISVLQHGLGWNWRLPEDTPTDHRSKLVAAKRAEVVFSRWPDIANPALGGKTVREVAGDDAYKIRILAAIMLVDLTIVHSRQIIDFNELRAALGLPECPVLDPEKVDVDRLSLMRLARLDVEKLSDDQLVSCYRRAALYGAGAAIQKLAAQVISRESLQYVDQAEAYGLLAQTAQDTAQSLEFIGKAREVAEGGGGSPAPWLLAELAVRIERKEMPMVEGLVQTIQQNHMRDPGVAEGLRDVLVRSGLINPDGSAGGPPPSSSGEAGAVAVPAGEAAGEPASALWTPDGNQPESGEKESKLWTPDGE